MDLVGPASNHAHIVEEEGRFRIRGAGVKSALGHRDLLAIISEARRRLVQKESARGYVLCHISIHQKWSKGSLYLLGCPTVDYSNGGSGTMFDGLLRGIRAKAQGHAQDNPFVAANNVTRLLQEVFQEGKSHVSVLATVSPGASCTEETVSVLNTLASVAPSNAKTKQPPIAESPPNKQENDSPKSVNGESELTLPRQWSQEELLEWMTRKNLLGNKLPSDVNGRYAMRMSKQQLQQTFYDAMDTRKAEKLYKALRAENDRVARMRVKLRIAKERERTNSGQHY